MLGSLLVLLALPQQTDLPARIAAQESATVESLLRMPDYRSRAWGAYLAGKYSLAERAPDLIAELARIPPAAAGSGQESRLVQTLLDALIQLRAPVEPDVLLPLRPHWSAAVMILLAHHASENAGTLLALLDDKPRCEEWRTAGNLLLNLRAPGFAARLLKDARFRLTVQVTDGTTGIGFGGGVGGGVTMCGGFGAPNGYPPAALYRLIDFPSSGDVLLAPGPKPVYYRRTLPTERHAVCRTDFTCDSRPETQRYLGALASLGDSEARDLFERSLWVRWTDADSYRDQVQAAAKRQAQAAHDLLRKLIDAGLLRADEAADLRPAIEIVVEDRRKDAAGSLPAIGPVPVELD